MGNTAGVIKDGITLLEVETAMRKVFDNKFPGIFEVVGPDTELTDKCVGLRFRNKNWRDALGNAGDWVLVWFTWDYETTLIGGNHPNGPGIHFGYWLLITAKHGVAKEIGGVCYDDGDGEERPPEPETYANFVQWMDRQHSMRSLQERLLAEREEIPDLMLYWFDKMVEDGRN